MLDLVLIMGLGFLGSFGHCVGMCSPIAVAFALNDAKNQTNFLANSPANSPDHSQTNSQTNQNNWWTQLRFHLLLNLGRLVSYALVGAAIGGVGSVLIAGGQLAGIGGSLRRGMAIFTGLLLIWLALGQLQPQFLPQLPLLTFGKYLHDRLNRILYHFSFAHPDPKNQNSQSSQTQWWTPALLGSIWGLIPCGFLYAAQIKAAETGDPWRGAATMAAFGLGTMPSMVLVGVASARLGVDRRSQLFRLGSWLTLTIGILLLLRNDAMVDHTGHGALFLLMLALVARPLSKFWGQPLKYRRAIGVGAYILAIAHTAHMVDHTLRWNLSAFSFLLPTHQIALACGGAALVAMTPAAITSFDSLQQRLGKYWRPLHLLTIPALLLAAIHTVLIGSHYWGNLQVTTTQEIRVVVLGILVGMVLFLRWLKPVS
jgi:sulfite exporter TauE/SafE